MQVMSLMWLGATKQQLDNIMVTITDAPCCSLVFSARSWRHYRQSRLWYRHICAEKGCYTL